MKDGWIKKTLAPFQVITHEEAAERYYPKGSGFNWGQFLTREEIIDLKREAYIAGRKSMESEE